MHKVSNLHKQGNWILAWVFPAILQIHSFVCCGIVDVKWKGDYHLDIHMLYPRQ